MNRTIRTTTVVLCALLGARGLAAADRDRDRETKGAPPTSVVPAPPPAKGTAAPPDVTRLIVKLKPALAAAVETELPASLSLGADTVPTGAVRTFLSRHKGEGLRPLYPALVRLKKSTGRSERDLTMAVRERFAKRSARQRRAFAVPTLGNTYVLQIPRTKAADVEARLAALRADAGVEYAEADKPVSVFLTPNDPYYSSVGSWGQAYDDLYGIKKIDSATAWDTTAGDGVVVAVVDTGLDINHPDIAANVWTNPGEIPGNGIDDDGNGFVDDVHGWDFVNDEADLTDLYGHGTHVAGTIAAVGNNGTGVIGVAYKARIMPVQIFGANGESETSEIAAAIQYAAANGADVMSNSWGGFGTSQAIADAMVYAHDLGVVIVVAAGNSSMDAAQFYPAGLPTVITVSALAPDDTLAYFSNFGKIDVGAPGVDILSLRAAGNGLGPIVGTDYMRLSGTSMATPHVSGVAALVLAQHPEYSNEQVRQVLRVSAMDVELPGYDPNVGYGRVDAAAALGVVDPLEAKIMSPVDGTVIAESTPITLSGIAQGGTFVSYLLEYGKGASPSSWTPIGSSTTPVAGGTLGTFDTTGLGQGPFTIRLTATNGTTTFSDRVRVRVPDNQAPTVQITSPASGASLSGIVTVTVDAHDNAGIGHVDLFVDSEWSAASYTAPFSIPWNTVFGSNGAHTFQVIAYDTSELSGWSDPVPVTIANSGTFIHVTSPASGAILAGPVTFSADVSDTTSLARVVFYVDGTAVGTTFAPPFSVVWNSAFLTNGSHTVSAFAFDLAGRAVISPPVAVTSNNVALLKILSPVAGAHVTGTVPVVVQVSSPVSSVTLFVDHNPVAASSTAPYGFAWPSQFFANGAHSLAVLADDGQGHYMSSAVVSVTTTNGPAVQIVTPANGAPISGVTTITTQIAAGITPTGVLFLMDNTPIGYSSTPPFSLSWDTGVVLNGNHTLLARLYDGSGLSALSAPVAVSTSNSGFATYDAALKVPACAVNTGVCDSGPWLSGRSVVGPELHAPNTIAGACLDGMAGTFHSDESNDRLRVTSLDGQPFAEGQTVRIEATVWNFGEDFLDLYYAADATSPAWTFLITLKPSAYGPQVLSATYTLPPGGLQAVRAQFRYRGSTASNCNAGAYDDHDDLVFVVNGIPSGPESFYTLPPCRMLDTRNAPGVYGAPALLSFQDRTFPLAGRCGVPATAKALSVNLTVTGSTALGYLKMYPTGQVLPSTSVINFGRGQTRANNAMLMLNADRQLTVRADMAPGATVQFILDVNGYFE